MKGFDAIILGAGAAGLMAAIEAGKRGRKVLVLDHAKKLGMKILISGGGRCNFTNKSVCAENYVSNNPHFCKSALARFTPNDFIALVEKHQIPYHEKKLGQLFCDHSAQNIIDMLAQESRAAAVQLQLDTQILKIEKREADFFIQTQHGDYRSTALVVATGGLSLPKTGASGLGYDIAKQFGLNIVPRIAALDAFIFTAELRQKLTGLAGVSLPVRLTCNGVSFSENILFTHLGLSGPAALQASLYWQAGDSLLIDLVPDLDLKRWFLEKSQTRPKAKIKNLLLEFFPKSFAEKFTELYLSTESSLAETSEESLHNFMQNLRGWTLFPLATVGYSKAEVTRGGIDTDELSSKTMEAKKVAGLYFIGEVVDVTGWLGGYNFQWAWSSAWVAGQYI